MAKNLQVRQVLGVHALILRMKVCHDAGEVIVGEVLPDVILLAFSATASSPDSLSAPAGADSVTHGRGQRPRGRLSWLQVSYSGRQQVALRAQSRDSLVPCCRSWLDLSLTQGDNVTRTATALAASGATVILTVTVSPATKGAVKRVVSFNAARSTPKCRKMVAQTQVVMVMSCVH